MVKFSIITVCLNEEVDIRRTCDSIISQSFTDFEWIVIDGQSTDGTLGILSEYDTKIRCLVSEPDNGIYDAMNKGIHLANGEYLLFLNAGDYLFDADVLDVVSRSPRKDVLYGNLECINENGENIVKYFPDKLSRYFLLRNMMPHQASFIRRSLFERYGGYNTSFKIAGDYDMFVRFLRVHKASYFHVPKVLAFFKFDGISSSLLYRALRKKENHHIRKKYFPWVIYGMKGIKMEFRLRFTGVGR